MLRILLMGPILLMVAMFRLLNSRFGVAGLIVGVLVMMIFGATCLFVGIANAFHVNTVLGLITLLPPLWHIDWLFGLINLVTGENVWQLLANLIHLAQTGGK